jgi:hypothetical protein
VTDLPLSVALDRHLDFLMTHRLSSVDHRHRRDRLATPHSQPRFFNAHHLQVWIWDGENAQHSFRPNNTE